MENKLSLEELAGARLAIEDAEQAEHYSNYLGRELDKLPLLHLWDECFLAALVIYYSGAIPNCVQGLDMKSLEKASEFSVNEDTAAILEPLQKWVFDQVEKSIKEKEIQPVLIGRFIDGRINPKRTYVGIEVIDDWLITRGIRSIFHELEYFSEVLMGSFGRIYEAIASESALLSARIYNPALEISDVIPKESHIDVHLENWKLRGLLKRQTSAVPSKEICVHGNTERFAKNREQVLGAAIYVMTNWPGECQNGSGKFEATKIAVMIDEKSLLIWPKTGKPPLSRQKMEREISKWINSTVK